MSKTSSPFGPFADGHGVIRITCRSCAHSWLYTGQTPYAQCRCGVSNNLNSEDTEFSILSE